MAAMKTLPRGIYTPLPCFFKEDEDVGTSDSFVRAQQTC